MRLYIIRRNSFNSSRKIYNFSFFISEAINIVF